MDILSRFPPEVFLLVFSCFEDLETAYNLVTASPAATKLFECHGASIVEHLVSTTLPYVFQPLARSVAVLRTASPDRLPYSSDAYDQQFIASKVGNRVLADLMDATPEPRRILVWAARIARFEHAILARLLRAVHRIGLLPETFHPTCTTYGSASDVQYYTALSYPGCPSRVRQPHAAWAPSWVERFRVRRALWRLATVLSMPACRIQMKQIAWSGVWPPPDFPGHPFISTVTVGIDASEEYQRLLLPSVWRTMQSHERQELASVYSCLRTIFRASPLDFVCKPPRPIQAAADNNDDGTDPMDEGNDQDDIDAEEEKFETIRKAGFATVDALIADTPTWTESRPAPRDDELGCVWHQDSVSVYSMNPGLAFYLSMTGAGLTATPLSDVSSQLRIIRRFGLAIWDMRRLVGLEMAYPDASIALVAMRAATIEPDTELDLMRLRMRLTASEVADNWREIVLGDDPFGPGPGDTDFPEQPPRTKTRDEASSPPQRFYRRDPRPARRPEET